MNYNDATQAKCKHYPSTFQCTMCFDANKINDAKIIPRNTFKY